MEIELTSQRDDDTWTWRAAGARQPRGVIPSSMIGAQPKVGDQLRVEAEIELEGITILSVLPSRDRPAAAERIELIAPPPVVAVTTSLVSRAPSRGRRPPDGDRDRPDRPSGPRRDAPRRGAERTPREPRGEGAPTTGERPRTDRRPPRADQRPTRTTRPEQGGADRATRPPRPRAESGSTEAPSRTRPPRFSPHSVHRDALIGGLAPEERPIAEQLAAGGLPAVRRALAAEQDAARAAGRPPVGGEAIIALAEQLLPRVHEATWLDRAESAVEQLGTLSLRDLRATIAGAAPRDDAGRELLRQLRNAYDERLAKLRTTWESEIAHALEEGRVLQALRLSARLPEPSARFPAALVQPLAEAASTSLTDKTTPDRWIALLEAAAGSPVRRLVKPAGLPEDPSGTVRQAATVAAGSVPALAALLGLAMPPPPRPAPGAPSRPTTTTRPPRARRPAGSGAPRRDSRPIPPPPVEVPSAADSVPSASATLETPASEESAAPEAPAAVVTTALAIEELADERPPETEAETVEQARTDEADAPRIAEITVESRDAEVGQPATEPAASGASEPETSVPEASAPEASGPPEAPSPSAPEDAPARVDDAVLDQPLEEPRGEDEPS